MPEKPLVNNDYLLQKFPGKGGWTYAEIPEVLQDKSTPFGWVKVRGTIDGYELKGYKLAPMGNGRLFLPVKSAIRKKIGKEEGDTVHVVLYKDELPMEIPDEIVECFKNEPPKAWEVFRNFSESEQRHYLNWIYESKKDDTKAERIVKMMDRLLLGKKMYDPD